MRQLIAQCAYEARWLLLGVACLLALCAWVLAGLWQALGDDEEGE